VLDLAPDQVTVPTLGAVWRSILGAADFSVFVYGATGRSKKTGLAVIIEVVSASPSVFAVKSECDKTLAPGKS
jgi:hypothetical protein